jgi:hypothetical protein
MSALNGGRRIVWRVLVIAAGLVGSAGRLAAQDARVLGRVTDGIGNPVAQATLTLVRDDGSASQSATSGQGGGFQFQGVAPGTYTLRAVHDGYAVREQRITVRPGRVVTPVVRLASAGRTQRARVVERTAR